MRVLVVSISFPPKKDPECIQTARYFKYLSKHRELILDILTTKSPTLFMPEDESLKIFDKGYQTKYEIKIFENRYLNFILRFLPSTIYSLPDSKAPFHLKWEKAINGLHEKPDIVYSRSYPLSSNLMAYRVVEHFDIPWVLHLSDPWADSPLHDYSKKEKDFHELWERRCFQRASRICLTSTKSRNFYIRKYPQFEAKLKLFPNVFDPDDLKSNRIEPSQKLRIVYTGGLAGTRSPKVFLDALQKFCQTNQKSDKLEVIFAGPMDRRMATLVGSYNIPNFTHLGELNLDESLELQRSAHVLLIIDSQIVDSAKSMFFPSKILEYVLSERKMMAITNKESTTAVLLENQGHEHFDFDEMDEVVSYLNKITMRFLEGQLSDFHVTMEGKEFDAAYNANRLCQLFRDL